MRYLRTPFAATLLSLAACTGPSVNLNIEQAALAARAAALVAAEEARDIDAALGFWAQDAVLHPAGEPPVSGPAAIRTQYEAFLANPMVTEFEGATTSIELAASGDMAWESGTTRTVIETPDGPLHDIGKYLAVWAKRDGEWYIVALSYNSNAPAPTPVATP